MAECVHESVMRGERRRERQYDGRQREREERKGGGDSRRGENCIAGGIEKPACMSQ